jgi:hypothetical protein
MLFKLCSVCKTDSPSLEYRTVGTMVEVTSSCNNLECKQREVVWQSQPNLTGTKMPAGNFLLCLAILVSGRSASKVLQMFKHMGLACFSLNTYFQHQRVSLTLFSIVQIIYRIFS